MKEGSKTENFDLFLLLEILIRYVPKVVKQFIVLGSAQIVEFNSSDVGMGSRQLTVKDLFTTDFGPKLSFGSRAA